MSDGKTKKSNWFSSFFKGVATEYKKIVFPTKDAVAKETAATIIVSVLIGLLIALLDLVIKSGLGFILK